VFSAFAESIEGAKNCGKSVRGLDWRNDREIDLHLLLSSSTAHFKGLRDGVRVKDVRHETQLLDARINS
jgi:hypothetical protein